MKDLMMGKMSPGPAAYYTGHHKTISGDNTSQFLNKTFSKGDLSEGLDNDSPSEKKQPTILSTSFGISHSKA